MNKLTPEEILHKPNQLFRELTSVSGFNPFIQHTSSPRGQMITNHLGQCLVVKGGEERSIQTGMERAFGKYTFNIKAPEEFQVVAVIPRYSSIEGRETIKLNPQTIVVYEEMETGRLGSLDIRGFCSHHQHFGFDYKPTENVSLLSPGNVIKKDTIFYDSTSKTANGGYMYGAELNVLHATIPGVSEDGTIISKSAAKKLTYNTYEKRVIEFGPDTIPLNLNGNDEVYKILPDIGERVRDDGLLYASRDFVENLSPFYQSKHALQKYFTRFDNAIYVPPGGVVVDIEVQHDELKRDDKVLTGMDHQLLKYHRSLMNFYKEIIRVYYAYKKKRGDGLVLTPDFERLLIDAIGYTDPQTNNRPRRHYRTSQLDDWRVEVTIRYENVPSVGNKLSCIFADKGIVVSVLPDEDMPVMSNGVRADMVSDPLATIGRSTIGRVIEPYINATGYEILSEIAIKLNLQLGKVVSPNVLEIKNSDGRVRQAFEKLRQFYHIVSPEHMGPWHDNLTDKDLYEHLASIISRGQPFIYKPASDDKATLDIIDDIMKFHKPNMSEVTYKGLDGKMVTTTEKFLIAKSYVILLDKTGDDAASTASCKLGHFDVPSQITRQDKYAYPNRRQPVRFYGESEMRILASYTEPWVVAETIDRNTNKVTMGIVVENILNSKNPASIKSLVDRKEHPFGGTRPLQIVQHSAACAGWTLKYSPYKSKWTTNQAVKWIENKGNQHD